MRIGRLQIRNPFSGYCLPHSKQGCRSMAVSTWLARRNEKARSRLMRNLPDVFPGAVIAHALSRPFLPATPRRAVDSYWRYHPVRADKPVRSLPLAANRTDGCGESESRNRGHWLVFGCPQPRFVSGPTRRAKAIAVCAGSPYSGSAGIATFGAITAQIRTLHSIVVALQLGTYGLHRAIMSDT